METVAAEAEEAAINTISSARRPTRVAHRILSAARRVKASVI